ncbi:hypothetical protein LMG28614_05935 [Paraburkholderia ultramafica]|uniref:Uncharacterized protein n=1 Tax=Paraburkholderia ultramafica TaxID=1544867 RepID=A0A6S7DFF9_9BURK|nr:hypothetical protein LMG28614_05935 [Paraburkholderia ultramafica]
MKYLGLAYFTPEKFAAMAPDDVKEFGGCQRSCRVTSCELL